MRTLPSFLTPLANMPWKKLTPGNDENASFSKLSCIRLNHMWTTLPGRDYICLWVDFLPVGLNILQTVIIYHNVKSTEIFFLGQWIRPNKSRRHTEFIKVKAGEMKGIGLFHRSYFSATSPEQSAQLSTKSRTLRVPLENP